MSAGSTSGVVQPTVSVDDVNKAIAQFESEANKAAVLSIDVSTAITKINGVDNAIKKINPA